jgi:hypothetical protein
MSKPIETETLWTLRSVTFGGNFYIYRPNGQRAGEVYSLADANQIVDALNDERLDQARKIFEDILAENFTAIEQGLGEEERDMMSARNWHLLRTLLGARLFCNTCGEYYTDRHNCDDGPDYAWRSDLANQRW